MSIPLDGNPLTENEADAIGDAYFAGCCATPHSAAVGLDEPDYLNHNAFFDSARRFSQFVRFVDRHQITGYEVKGEKSILYFTLRDLGGGATVLDGITDAIATTAPESGWSNEWLLLPYFRPYSPHDTHTLSIPNFAEYYDIWQRGQWHAPETEVDEDLLWHISYGAKVVGYGNLLAESVSGYNYAKLYTPTFGSYNLNYYPCGGDPGCEAENLRFYKSVQIYKPPYEIESAESVTLDGIPQVRVTLKTRLHNTLGEVDGVPAGDISRDVSTWDGPTLAAEPFRTDENALRLYLLWVDSGYNPAPTVGDWARAGEPNTHYDSIFASIMPTFVLVRLMPLPHEDDNDTAQSTDSPTWHDWFLTADWYLRAMCEGYVDEVSSLELACNVSDPDGIPESDDETCLDTGADIYDYTFENLMLDASGGTRSSMLSMPSQTTDSLDAEDVVAAPWPSYGPLPKTPRAAEVFNLYSAAVNKLTKARLMLPFELWHRTIIYGSDALNVPPTDLCGSAFACGVTGKQVWIGTGNPASNLLLDEGWDNTPEVLYAETAANFTFGCGPDYQLVSTRHTVEIKFDFLDAGMINTIPLVWRELVTDHTHIGMMGCVWRYDIHWRWSDAETTPCDPPYLEFACGFEEVRNQKTACAFIREGLVDFGATPPGGLHAAAWQAVPLASCQMGPARIWYAYPADHRTLYIEVPLEGVDVEQDQPEEMTE